MPRDIHCSIGTPNLNHKKSTSYETSSTKTPQLSIESLGQPPTDTGEDLPKGARGSAR